MKKSNLLGFLGLATILMQDDFPVSHRKNYIPEKKVKFNNSEKPQPSGTKEYFFTETGMYSNTEIAKVELFYKCFAVNDKNAIRKFNQFKNSKKP